MLIEEFIEGRELTVGILENKICGLMEIKYNEELYDYNNKYINIAEHIINPKLPIKIQKELIENSLKVHSSLNCNCISRIDFRYNEEKIKHIYLKLIHSQVLRKIHYFPKWPKKKKFLFLNFVRFY